MFLKWFLYLFTLLSNQKRLDCCTRILLFWDNGSLRQTEREPTNTRLTRAILSPFQSDSTSRCPYALASGTSRRSDVGGHKNNLLLFFCARICIWYRQEQRNGKISQKRPGDNSMSHNTFSQI